MTLVVRFWRGWLLTVCLLGCGYLVVGQTIPRDTSYTIHSTHRKLLKDYPFIQPISPSLPKGARAQIGLVYKTLGQRQLQVDVFYPSRKKRRGYPGVLLIHGGGWSSGDKANLVPMAQQLAAKGYVAVAVEYRLSPEAIFPAGVRDLKEALRWMRAHAREFSLDTSRVAALGCSAGAQLASLLGTALNHPPFESESALQGYSARVQAIVNVDGIVSFVHPEASAEGSAAAKWLGGSRAEAWDKWKEASPLEYAGPHLPPFLFINSSIPRFHAGRDDLIKHMASNGIYSEVHTLPDSPHAFWLLHPWFETTVELTLGFLDKVFKGKGEIGNWK